MWPTVFFDSVKIVGPKDKAINFTESANSNATFKAENAMPGVHDVYKFWAFDDAYEKIKKLKLNTGDFVSVIAEMKSWTDEKNSRHGYSFTIKNIDRVHCAEQQKQQMQTQPKPQKEQSSAANRPRLQINPEDVIVVPRGYRDLESFTL